MRLVCGGIQLNAKILTPLEPHMLYCMYQLKPLGTSISQCCSDGDRFHSCFSIGWGWGRMHSPEKKVRFYVLICDTIRWRNVPKLIKVPTSLLQAFYSHPPDTRATDHQRSSTPWSSGVPVWLVHKYLEQLGPTFLAC